MGVMQRLINNLLVQTADFFRADNPEGMEARNEVKAYGFFLFLKKKKQKNKKQKQKKLKRN